MVPYPFGNLPNFLFFIVDSSYHVRYNYGVMSSSFEASSVLPAEGVSFFYPFQDYIDSRSDNAVLGIGYNNRNETVFVCCQNRYSVFIGGKPEKAESFKVRVGSFLI